MLYKYGAWPKKKGRNGCCIVYGILSNQVYSKRSCVSIMHLLHLGTAAKNVASKLTAVALIFMQPFMTGFGDDVVVMMVMLFVMLVVGGWRCSSGLDHVVLTYKQKYVYSYTLLHNKYLWYLG